MKSSFPVLIKQNQAVLEWLFFLLVVIGYFVWLSTNTVYSASANGRLLDAFDGDEYVHFYAVRQALTDRTVCIDFPYYGHFYFNIILFPLLVLQKLVPISDHVLILALRYVSTISSVLTVVLTFGLSQRYFNKFVAWFSSIFLMVLPYIFNYWSVTSHPDTLQMLTVVAALFACCEFIRSQKKKWLIVAAVFAGLAFSAKYGGILLMPIVWLLCFAQFDGAQIVFNRSSIRFDNIRSAIKLVFMTGAAFLLAFIVTSPCLFFGGQFIYGILIQVKWTSAGYIFQTNDRHVEWFEILSSPALLGFASSIILLLAFLSFLIKGWVTRAKSFLSYEGLLWFWVLFYFGYAFFRVNLREDRHLLVIIPFVFILVTSFFSDLLGFLEKRTFKDFKYYIALMFIVVFSVFQVWGGITRQLGLIESRMTQELNNPAIEVGWWLEANYSPSTKILYDKYTYIPPVFEHIRGTWGMNEAMMKDFDPRVVVINPSIRDIFLSVEDSPFYSEGEDIFLKNHDFYQLMEEGKLGYVLVKEFGRIRVYEKAR